MINAKTSLLSLATTALLADGAMGASTFPNPTFFGAANTTYQEWDAFTAPPGPNIPDSMSNGAGTPNYFDRNYPSDNAFIIGTPGGDLYSFNGVVAPEIDVPMPALGAPGFSTVVLQAQVFGSPIDQSTFQLSNGSFHTGPTGINVVSTPQTGFGMPTFVYTYTVTFGLLPLASNYTITYTPNAFSSAQQDVRVDTISQTPEPGTLGLSGLALIGMATHRRNR